MNSLAYLVRATVKNHVLSILRTPAKLVMAVSLLVVFGAGVVSAVVAAVGGGGAASGPQFLLKFFAVWFTVMYLLIVLQTATTSGQSIFSMPDVNLVFTSPLSPRLVLGYGAARMMWSSLLGAVSLLFMVMMFNRTMGLPFGALLAAVGVFFLALCLMAVGSLVAYNLTNGRPWRRRALRVGVAACCLPAAIALVVEVTRTGVSAEALETWVASPWLTWTPIVGWTGEAAYALAHGDRLVGLGFLGLIVAAMAGLAWWFARGSIDFYEDAVVATQTRYEKVRAVQSGEATTYEAISDKTVTVRGTGVGGFGASAFFHKQLREARRASRIGPWGASSLFLVLVATVMALLLRDEDNTTALVPIIVMLCLFQFLIVSSIDRGMNELSFHYVFLVPESSFAKIVGSNLQSSLKSLGEAVVAYAVAGVVLAAHPALVVLAVVVHVGFTALMTGFLLAVMRLTGVNASQKTIMILYAMGVFVVQAPGAVVGSVVGFIVGELTGAIVGLAVFAAWEVTVAVLCFLLARDCLDRADILTAGTRR